MITPDPSLVYGYAQLADILSTTKQALYVRKSRGRLGLEPVYYIGRTAVFDRETAIGYAAQQHIKK